MRAGLALGREGRHDYGMLITHTHVQAKGDSYVMQLLNIIVSGTEESLLMGVVDVLLVVPLSIPGPVSQLQPVPCYILNDLLQSVALMDELVWST